MTRPSPWTTPFAYRTYASGALWVAGMVASALTKVPYAVELGRRARRTVRFNITVALALKLALAAGAVAGVVTLAVAVLVGDMGGSLLVTLNALRLAHLPPPGPHQHSRA